MALTLELPADLLADLNAEAAYIGTSPEAYVETLLQSHFATDKLFVPSVRKETREETAARIAADEAAYNEWWEAQSPEEQERLNAKWEASSRAADEGRHYPADVVFARIRAKYATHQYKTVDAHK